MRGEVVSAGRKPPKRSAEAQATIDRLQADYAALESKYRELLYGTMKTEESQKDLAELRARELAAASLDREGGLRDALARAEAGRDEIRRFATQLVAAVTVNAAPKVEAY
jgi:hypothetical protein